MDGTPPVPAKGYDGPPDYRALARHALSPQMSHDEIERLNFLTHMNRHLAQNVLPFVSTAYDKRAAAAFTKRHGHAPADRHEARHALLADSMFQTWSALRRATMEQRQQAGRWTTLRQAEELADKARVLTDGDARLKLDPAVPLPNYVAKVDHHCMPGSYHREAFPGDVANGANYDHGLFVTTAGGLGPWNSGGGHAIVDWVKRNLPDFKPKRILEMGATLGHNLLPIAQAFPDAEVIAIDVGAPMLRYGLARAKALGVNNITFIQADACDLVMFEDQSFDWVQTTMFLHELSHKALRGVLKESRRLLKPGGLVLHVEQPQYDASMSPFETAMRDWDGYYNNEPFWGTLHALDFDAYMVEAGFDRAKLVHAKVKAIVEADDFPRPKGLVREDFGRRAAWDVIGARV